MKTENNHNKPPSTKQSCSMNSDTRCSTSAPLPETTKKNEVEDFFRNVSIEFLVHELKSPVSVIESSTYRLLDKQEPAAPLSPHLERSLVRIFRNAQKTREMLNQLLEVGRARDACFQCRPFSPWRALQRSTLEVVESSLPDLMERMGELNSIEAKLSFLAQHGIRLERSADIETLTIEQDEIKFCQIVGNLIKNGLHYRRRHLLIHATQRKEALSISIRDDGPGIAAIHHEAIFQRYKQITPCEGVARHGHGLGLAAARILARALGGNIYIQSELGQGALFHFSIPFVLTHRSNSD